MRSCYLGEDCSIKDLLVPAWEDKKNDHVTECPESTL